MEKSDKKRILTRVLIVIAALTLLSCCFLGSTFAKYVTNASGTGSVPIALWDIDVTNNAQTSLTFDKLSPDIDDGGVQSTGSENVITITNSGDVQATVEVTSTSISPNWKDGYNQNGQATNYDKWGGLFDQMFKVTVSPASGEDLVLAAKNGDTTDSVTISATVTWTTINDEVDTWYGEWLESITVSFEFSATQSSELPTT